MTVNLKPVVTLALLSLVLPGCSALFGKNKLTSQTGTEEQIQVAAEAAPVKVAVMTDAGRKALDHGNAGMAIEAFTRAVTSGEAPAPALNGLGVAYARIGRFDLAQRYFQRAAQIDPDEMRYQSNLSRLMRSPLFAKRHQADEANAMLARAEEQQAAAAKTRQAAAPGQLQRVGANQFYIKTAAPTPGAGPVRTAMVITRAKTKPVIEARTIEAAFDATVGTGAPAAVEEKAKTRTIFFKPG
ncbi:tetratricopeptide repeat protein [Novosphingobium sp.]|uniref:tetratricopeptide repeat protein n=1 Tax=Novosphingobium sp. TaxID=1874826 RepID=UPI0025EF6ECD|nr:tetratricopeptide repeat protein [Novosphingobium sp.]